MFDLSWQTLTILRLNVNFIMERNSSLLIKLGGWLQKGRKSWQMQSQSLSSKPPFKDGKHTFFFSLNFEFCLIQTTKLKKAITDSVALECSFVKMWIESNVARPLSKKKSHFKADIRSLLFVLISAPQWTHIASIWQYFLTKKSLILLFFYIMNSYCLQLKP